jgi:S1-C subfamily serine protease
MEREQPMMNFNLKKEAVLLMLLFCFNQAGMAAYVAPLSSKEKPETVKKLDIAAVIQNIQESVVDIKILGKTEWHLRKLGFVALLFSDFLEKDQSESIKIPYESSGSGVILDASGLILTNAHVVSQFDQILVRTASGKEMSAKLINKDIERDLALLQAEGPQTLKPVVLADPKQIKVTDKVFAIGNPYSYGHTVSEGIVSALNRYVEIDSKHKFNKMIQTTADANPGNSGGPLINEKGEMIGLVTIGDMRARGINFAISVETINERLPVLKKPSVEPEAYKAFTERFGFSLQERKDKGGEKYLVISDLKSMSQAAKAGLKTNDVLQAFHSQEIKTLEELLSEVKKTKPGENIRVQILRNQRSFFTYVGAK